MNHPQPDQAKGDVLIVDDALSPRHVLSRMLAEYGYRVQSASDGPTALTIAGAKPPDLILLDVMLPGMDGYKVCQCLKGEAETRDIPVIFISALNAMADRVRGFEVGGVDYIVKPFQNEEVLARVQTHLAIRELQKQLEAQNAQLQQEITDRKRAEDALRASEQRLALAVEASGIGIYEHTVPLGPETYHSERWASILGYRLQELPAHDYLLQWLVDQTHPDDQPRLQKAYSDFIEGRIPRYDIEIRMKHRSGNWIYVQDLSRGVVRDEHGRVTRIIGVMLDITDRKRAEEELRRQARELARSNAELEQFAYVTSHDLQEPLRAISGYLQFLQRRYGDKLGEDADLFITRSVAAAMRMRTMINDLLTYSRLDIRGKEFELTDSSAALGQAMDNLQVAIEESDAVIVHDPLPLVMADASQLVQLFQNLLGNAIKFRSDRRPEIHVGAEHLPLQQAGEGWDGGWLFSVQDNGIGIEPGHAERIFAIFQRLHTWEEYPGTGIGLAVCKKIVARHGGRIWVESEPGLGSAFYFTLPARGVSAP